MSKLYALVVEAYQNALDNGYDMNALTSEEVAEDMCSFDAAVEEYSYEEILACVKTYRMEDK